MENLQKQRVLMDIIGGVKKTGALRIYKTKESLASQTFGLLFWALLYCPKNVDLLKSLNIILTGRLYRYTDNRRSYNNAEAMDEIAKKLERPEIFDLFWDYDNQRSKEALFVKKIINLEQVYQARYDFSKGLISKLYLDSIEELFGCEQKSFSAPKNLDKLINVVGKFKTIERTGFVIRVMEHDDAVYKKEHFETDAEHTFSLLFRLFAWHKGESADLLKKFIMGILHDMPEFMNGDITPICVRRGVVSEEVRKARELKCMKYICTIAQRPEWMRPYEDYNENKTPNAQAVKSTDKEDFLSECVRFQLEGRFPQVEVEDVFNNYSKSGAVKNSFIWGLIETSMNISRNAMVLP